MPGRPPRGGAPAATPPAAPTPTGSAVQWEIVTAELSRVPSEFQDPKFYALKHVVEILSANDPQALVQQVRRRMLPVTARLTDGCMGVDAPHSMTPHAPPAASHGPLALPLPTGPDV